MSGPAGSATAPSAGQPGGAVGGDTSGSAPSAGTTGTDVGDDANAGVADDANAAGTDDGATDPGSAADDGSMGEAPIDEVADDAMVDDGTADDAAVDDSTTDEPATDDTSAGDPMDGTPPDTSAELPPGDAAPVISNLMVEPNPNSTISCYVSWVTDVAANSEVQFGIGDAEFRIVSNTATTEHRVLVIGMYEESDYLIRAVSSNTAGSTAMDGAFTTGSLPSEVPLAELTANEPGAFQEGWTLTNIMVGSGGGFGSSSPAVMVMYDELGVPVWYYVNGDSADNRGDVSVDPLANGNILIGPAPGESPREIDLGGNIVWEGPPNGGGGMDIMSHHGGQLENGNYIVLRDLSDGNIIGAQVEEYTPDNELVWDWSLLDHTTPPAGASGDWCHANSVTVDLDADVIYVNCRFLGIYKAQRSGNQDILWHMGGTQSPDVPGDFTYPIAGSQFNDAHDPEFHEDGTVLLYDNGGYAGLGGGGNNFHSRVLEYQLDETAKSATLIWEFPGSFDVDPWYTDDWYAAFWGDSDRLANDNVLITAGLKGADLRTRIFEVTREGQVVWEITLPNNQGSYRAERLSPPPLVQRMP